MPGSGRGKGFDIENAVPSNALKCGLVSDQPASVGVFHTRSDTASSFQTSLCTS